MENKIPSYLLQPANNHPESAKGKGAKLSFLDKTIMNTASAVKSIYVQAENASKENVIQRINPYVKLILMIYFILIISIVSHLEAQLIITINKPLHFRIYTIPRNIGFTENGFKVVSLIFLRILNSVSFAMLIVFTTSFPSFIKSFKILGVPDTFMMIISLAYKYIFILSRIIEETYFALKSRLSGNINNSRIRELISGRIFFIFKKSFFKYLKKHGDCFLEQEPMRELTRDKGLKVLKHEGFWQCMDTVKDAKYLNDLWEKGNAPWKVWK